MSAGDVQEPEDGLDQILAEYFQGLESGRRPDEAALIERFPQYADGLRDFFSGRDLFQRLAEPFGPPANAAGRTAGASLLPRRFGDYELLQELARGGMGVVYKARQVGAGRVVALKMVLAGHLASAESVRRFQIEAENAAKLDHPNIVPIYDVGMQDDQPYFTMKLLEGGNLAQSIDGPCDDTREVAKLMSKVARAVHHAHERGVLHRDLKPSNIVLHASGEPSVTDFGLARGLGEDTGLTVSGAAVGTPRYMAPEQAESGHALTTAADVYGLGAIRYEALTGRPPFRAESTLAVLSQIRERDPERPSTINPKIDRDVETICLKCLEKEPGRRYASAAALADDLNRWLAGEPVEARPVGRAVRLWRWCRRSPAVAALTIAVSMLAVVVLLGALLAAHKSKAAAERERQLSRTSEERLARGLLSAADGLAHSRRFPEARATYWEAVGVARKLVLPDTAAMAGLLAVSELGPPPLQGPDSARGLPGGFELHSVPRGGESPPLNTIDFVGTSPLALGAYEDGNLRIWDASTGILVKTLTGHAGAVTCSAVSADGSVAVSGGAAGEVKVWTLPEGACKFTSKPYAGGVQAIGLTADGRTAAVGRANGEIRLLDLGTGTEVGLLSGHQGWVRGVGFSADGATIVSGGDDGTVRVWERSTGRQVREFREASGIRGLSVTADGTKALSGCEHVATWDLAAGKQTGIFRGHRNIVWNVTFLPGNREALSAGTDRAVRLWDVRSGVERRTFAGHEDLVRAIAVSPDGRLALSGGPGDPPRLWPLAPGGEIASFRGHRGAVRDLTFTSDGRLALSAAEDNKLILWDVATGMAVRQLLGHSRPVTGCKLLPDGRRAISSSDDATMILWDLETGTALRRFGPHGAFLTAVALSPDGRTAVSAGNETVAKVWDVESGQELKAFRGHDGGALRGAAFAPDGRSVLTAGDDQTVRQWDVASGSQLRVLRGHSHMVWAVCYSPDGRTALSASWDKRLRLWDLANGREVRQLVGHDYAADAVAFSPDGRLAMSGSWDRTVRLWDVGTGKELWNFPGHTSTVNCVAFSPDGSSALSGGLDALVRHYDFSRPDRYQRLSAALPAAREALRANPRDANALAAFGRWYAFRGVYDWALDFLSRSRAIGGSDVSDLELARCYWRSGKVAEANSAFARALERKEAPAAYLQHCLRATAAK